MMRDRLPSPGPGGSLDRLRAWLAGSAEAAYAMLAVVGTYLVMTTLLHVPLSPEHWSADLRTKYLSTRPATQHPRIALIYVTEKTLASHAYVSPTDRQLLADLVRTIDAAGPAVIGFDFIIDRASEPAKDDALIAALRDAKAKVVVGAIDEPVVKVQRRGKSFQQSYLAKVKRPVGHLYFDGSHNALVVGDSVVRRMADPADKHDHPVSFAKQLIDAAGVPYAEPKSTYISWLLAPRDGSETFQSLPAEQVLGKDGASSLPLKEMLKGKIVLIGGDFTDRDQHLLPLSVTGDARYPGLFIHAQIVAQLIDGRSLAALSLQWQLVALILAFAIGYGLGRWMSQILLILELWSAVGLLLVAVAAFMLADVILPYTGLLLAWFSGLFVGRYTRPSGLAIRPAPARGR